MQFLDKLLSLSKAGETEEMFYSTQPSEDLIKDWAKRLNFFRYVKASGSFGDDIDELVLALRYAGEHDLIRLFQDLHVPYKRHSSKPPQPEPGRGYTSAEFAQFPSLIAGTNWIEQPVWQTIHSVTVSVWCTIDMARFTIVGPREKNWVITQIEFENAERLERIFEKHSQRIIDPPVDTQNCVCPKYYPQYWQAG